MRRLSKPSPPENVSPDGRATRPFMDAERDYRAVLPRHAEKNKFARTAFNQLDKPKLRAVMYREQRSVCVFCERQIAEAHPSPRIDHWRPLSRDHDHALHWKNLYLSCSTMETCDSAKGDRCLKWDDADLDLPWPVELDYENLVGFTSGGEIYVRNDIEIDAAMRRAIQLAIDDCPDGDRRRRAVLNLNHPPLREARKAALDAENTRLKRDLGDSHHERAARADELLRQDVLPEYVSIRVAWLRGIRGRGR